MNMQTPQIARSTSKNSVYLFRLDNKNVVFFTLDRSHLLLLSIYPYKKDIRHISFIYDLKTTATL